jgi:flagellar biosynthesis protein FlhG
MKGDKRMNSTNSSNKVINITNKIGERRRMVKKDDQCDGKSDTRVIAITSGKGGVGKTNIVANLGFAFSKLGKKVLILDADWGLGNLDVLLGLAAKFNLSHVIMGDKTLSEVIVSGPGDMQILPASSGIQELTQLTFDQKISVLTQLDFLVDSVDILLIDTAAGISSNVMDFNVTAQEILVVVSPEPTSLTDAYALMKVLSLKYAERHCKLLVNMVGSAQEALEIYHQLNQVVEKFLDISIEYVGCVLYDDRVQHGVRRQKIITELFPNSKASRCFATLAQKIDASAVSKMPGKDSNFIWDHLYRNQMA